MPKRDSGKSAREARRLTDQTSLNRAFELAHSIFRFTEETRAYALEIVTAALEAVEVRLSAQVEADRHDPDRPTKVRWNTAQWFQILLLCKSATYETNQEAGKKVSLSRDDMIIRYLKHLVVTTFRRNSFHVSLGLSRLVYGYSAAEAVAIYDLVFQDPDSSTRKADAYYRARKSKLIEELERRFHQFLKIQEGARGEKGFQLDPDSNTFSALVFEYLTRFAPWDTMCELPRELDGWNTITPLQSSQASQIHALMHPPCFAKIAEALKLAPPEQSLALPQFFLEGTMPPDQRDRSELSDSEITEIRGTLKDGRENRKKFKPESLRVLVDGVETARLTLDGGPSSTRFDLTPGATLIEVYGREKNRDLLMASHMVIDENGDSVSAEPEMYAITLEGGQKISLTITPVASNGSLVEIAYAAPPRSLWAQLTNRSRTRAVGPRGSKIPVPAWALIMIAAIGLSVAALLAVTWRSDDLIAKVEPTPQTAASPFPQTSPSPQRIASVPLAAPSAKVSPTPERTRGQTMAAIKSIAGIRNVFFMAFGQDAFSQSLHDKLVEKLRARVGVTTNADEADAAITPSVSIVRPSDTTRDQIGQVQLRFVNAAGETIWRTKRYRGTVTLIADEFARDLQAALQHKTGTKPE